MRKIAHLCSSILILLAVISFDAFNTGVYAQPADTVLARGNPPLTQSMLDRTGDFLEWLLDVDLSAEHKAMLKKITLRAWQTQNQGEIKSTLDLVKMHGELLQMSKADRDIKKAEIQGPILEGLRKETNDELSQIMVSAYDDAHSANSKTISNITNESAKSKMRVGADGFTGVYRMLRPRAININNTGSESGYYIEHITFLPGGNVYWTLPPEGLLYFDSAVAQRAYPDDWGTYEIRNGSIHILRGPTKEPYVITRSGERLNNPPSLGKGSFRPVPSADGLKLEGTYRRDKSEPAISFTKDGGFRDEGVFRYFGDLARPNGTTYQDDGRGGSGNYLIEQNTLELRYSDGRIKRHAFMTFPENLAKKSAVDNFILRAEETMFRF